MNKIAPRQLYFLLAAVMPVGKLILMPTQLAYYAKNDLLFPAAANFLLQAGIIFLIMLLSRSNRTFYDMLCYTFGKIAAKIVLSSLALFLFFAALLPLFEQKLMVQSVFYDTLPSIVAFAPFYLFSAYLCAKPLCNFGRAWDIIAPISIVGFFGIMLLSVSNAEFSALAPVGVNGAGGFFGGTAYTMSWFFDSALLLVLIGKFEYKKGMAWKSAVSYLIGAAAVLVFLAVFYGIFSDIAERQFFAFSKISKYFSGMTVLGRIDYLFIYSLALVMAYFCALPVHAGVDCLTQAYGNDGVKPVIFSVAINGILLVLSFVLDYRFGVLNDTITKTLFWIFPAFSVLMPLLALLLRRKPREKV
jgi:hypothetical protein